MAPTATAPATTPPASAAALQNLQGFQQSMQNPGDILSSKEQSLGVPQAQQQVSGLRQAITNTTNLLNSIPQSVEGRTGNSLVTSAQAGKMISNEQAPVQQNLSSLGQQEGQASSDLNTLLTRAQNEAQLTNEGQQQKLSALQQIYQNLFGGEQQAEGVRQFNTTQAESTREFNAKQTQDASQFKQNLALETKKYNLTAADQKERTRQFNAQQALEKQKFAETVRSDKAGEAIASQRAATSAARSSGAASKATAAKTAKEYKYVRDSAGGFQFFGPGGKPVTAGAYISGKGGNWVDLVKLLQRSANPGDAQLIKDIQKLNQAQLSKKYPWVFSGAK